MRLKQRIGDFRVRELLSREYLAPAGDHRVYRVTKRKLTSDEAARALAAEAGVTPGEVQLAGLKDRQGITIQYMSLAHGREVRIESAELKIEPVGFARVALSSEHSHGNAFELTVRALRHSDVARLRASLPLVREHGTINYFDDQRFGNLTHGQGWIFKELCAGRSEQALRSLLGARSPRDDERHRRFKDALEASWGDWRACRDAAGRFGAHHSIFEHLARQSGDFAGAFEHVATRLKLIHLYAWQSHLWNRAAAELVRELVPVPERLVMECVEGRLLGYRAAPPPALLVRPTLRLPGEALEDLVDPEERRIFEALLAQEGLAPADMRVRGVGGFQLKGEERALIVRPGHLRVRPAEADNLNPGYGCVRIRFELGRGSYASLVVKRLFARGLGEASEREAGQPELARDRPRRGFHARGGRPADDPRGGRGRGPRRD
jgi:tRNA pseudouridine13 synthase